MVFSIFQSGATSNRANFRIFSLPEKETLYLVTATFTSSLPLYPQSLPSANVLSVSLALPILDISDT